MIVFILDASTGLLAIMKHKEFSVDLSLVYFNILVMNVFNMTQLHLYFWILSKILIYIARLFENKWISKLIDYLFKILNVVWMKFDDYLKLIEQKLDP